MGVNSNNTTMFDQGTFENIGAVTWDTTVKTSGFTGVSGNGYFVNTTSAAITVTLPASPSAGDIIGIKDYANTADTNNITIGRNGSPIQGEASDFVIETEGSAIILVYVDATKGWLVTKQSQASDISEPALFTVATGGTITTSGDFKIHTFTGPGTFCVSQVGNCVGGPSNVDYLVVAGGAAGGTSGMGGGGGAGGYRESHSTPVSGCYSASPLATPTGITVSATTYPITVGAGGAVGNPSSQGGGPGSPSIFSSITSTGGGGGGRGTGTVGSGGSGGGNSFACAAGTGNTPPVSPPQGNNGSSGFAYPTYNAGGGGGATVAGSQGSPGGNVSGPGGAGATTSISGSSVTRAGGGGGGVYSPPVGGTPGAGGSGGGGAGGNGPSPAGSGSSNTGGGGGGGGSTPTVGQQNAGTGGSGIVIIRYKFQ